MIAENTTKTAVPDSVTLAFAVISDRVRALPEEDKRDLFEVAMVFVRNFQGGDQEEAESAARAMQEILAQEPGKVSRVSVVENPTKTVGQWVSWISAKIKELRNKADLTQDQLSEISGLPQSHISRLEKGEHSPSFATLKKLAKAFNVPVQELDPSAPDHACED